MRKPPDIWYPTLLQTANGINIQSQSWFDIKSVQHLKQHFRQKQVQSTFIKTKKYIIYPTYQQKNILHKWFHSVINMYNITNNYIKEQYNNTKKFDSFYTLRNTLKSEASILVQETDVAKHILDYSIKHCIEMYKSAVSNLSKGYIEHFNISNMKHTRNRFNLVLEPSNFSKKINGFYVNKLGEMKYDRPLNHLIQKNTILQYNKNKDKYYLLVPIDCNLDTTLSRDKLCGIDLGVRTFATVYSKNETLEIGSKITSTIDLYNKRRDQLKSLLDRKCISYKYYSNLMYKYRSKMGNKIDDLHKKVSVMLSKKFETINIGKISTSSIISNQTSNASDKTKRRLLVLSFYKFLERLKIVGKKYDCKINLISEYKTSMTCNNCKFEDKNLESNKIYNCPNCKLVIDRDINSAIIFYKGGYDSLM